MKSLVKFLYILSIIFFFLNIIFSYYQFPDYVAVGLDATNGLKEFKSKSFLFYAGLILFFIINMLVLIAKKVIFGVPFSLFPLPNKSFWLSSADHREGLVQAHFVWLNSFATFFNVFLGCLFLFLYLLNVVEFSTFHSFGIIVYVFMALLSGWWLLLLGRLYINKIEL